MANRVKEDEKNERIIRGLLKLPENKRCINCNSLGPQYACTSFWTFVCTTCSGIHREFTHRVKSVSMAKFTSQEVSALQAGGNQRAKDIYLKEWDAQRNSLPDGSNVDRLRDFIKHVYVDRRFTGDRNYDRPPRAKTGEREDSFQGGSRSPPYEESYDRRYSDRSSSGGRSPAYEQESRQYSDFKRSPSRPEIINDWRREDRFGNGKKFEDLRTSEGESKVRESPDRQKDLGPSSPPIVRPVREILGENVLPLRIGEPPKANGAKTADGLIHTQRTASSSSLGSTNGNAAEIKPENNVSLIDFDTDPQPVTVAASQPAPTTVNQAISQPVTSTSENNWASFDVAPATKITNPPNTNAFDSVLSQLTTPAPSALPPVGGSTSQVGNTQVFPLTAGASTVLPAGGLSALPQSVSLATDPGLMSTLAISGGNSLGMQPQQPSLFPAAGVQPIQQSMQPVHGASSHQSWNAPPGPSVQGPLTTVSSQLNVASKVPEQLPGVTSQNSSAEVKSSARKELPADLFTGAYASFRPPVMGWQTVPPLGMGYMQYNSVMMMPTLPQQAKSMNPFDISVPSQGQSPMFPSMTSLQSALPNVPPPSLMHASSFGTSSPSWIPPQPASYAPGVLQPQSALPLSAYMGQQMPGNMPPPGYPRAGHFGSEGASYGSFNTNQLGAANFSASHTTNSSTPVGGNPFG